MAQRDRASRPACCPAPTPARSARTQSRSTSPAPGSTAAATGRLVAVIDTGVRPGPRLPERRSGRGLRRVDRRPDRLRRARHAGGRPHRRTARRRRLLRRRAGRPDPVDPADLGARSRRAIPGRTRPPHGSRSTSRRLARAIVRAADLGARVINISAVTCLPANKTVDQTELGAALRYAAVDKDAVIVAAAGNNAAGSEPPGRHARRIRCRTPAVPRTRATGPASRRSRSRRGGSRTCCRSAPSTPAGNRPTSPWRDRGSGSRRPARTSRRSATRDGGGLANALPNERGELYPLNGTSYAAAYVSGVAALVRSRFPELTAEQVVDRLTASAQGAPARRRTWPVPGIVDPVAALTWDVRRKRRRRRARTQAGRRAAAARTARTTPRAPSRSPVPASLA